MDHVWVRHTIEKATVSRRPIRMPLYEPPLDVFVVRLPNPEITDPSRTTMYGCDNCGLLLTEALFEEPCLSDLEDQVESESEGGA